MSWMRKFDLFLKSLYLRKKTLMWESMSIYDFASDSFLQREQQLLLFISDRSIIKYHHLCDLGRYVTQIIAFNSSILTTFTAILCDNLHDLIVKIGMAVKGTRGVSVTKYLTPSGSLK